MCTYPFLYWATSSLHNYMINIWKHPAIIMDGNSSISLYFFDDSWVRIPEDSSRIERRKVRCDLNIHTSLWFIHSEIQCPRSHIQVVKNLYSKNRKGTRLKITWWTLPKAISDKSRKKIRLNFICYFLPKVIWWTSDESYTTRLYDEYREKSCYKFEWWVFQNILW